MPLARPHPELICPHCGFRIFNRRFPRCESCGADLPRGLLYSAEEIKALEAKEAAQEQQRRGNGYRLRRHSDGGGWDGASAVCPNESDGACGTDGGDGGGCGGGGGE